MLLLADILVVLSCIIAVAFTVLVIVDHYYTHYMYWAESAITLDETMGEMLMQESEWVTPAMAIGIHMYPQCFTTREEFHTIRALAANQEAIKLGLRWDMDEIDDARELATNTTHDIHPCTPDLVCHHTPIELDFIDDCHGPEVFDDEAEFLEQYPSAKPNRFANDVPF